MTNTKRLIITGLIACITATTSLTAFASKPLDCTGATTCKIAHEHTTAMPATAIIKFLPATPLVPATAVTGDNVVPMQKLVLADATAVNATGETQIVTLTPAIAPQGGNPVAITAIVESTQAATLVPATAITDNNVVATIQSTPATAVTGDNVVPMQKLVLADATAVNATGETQIATLTPAIAPEGGNPVAITAIVESSKAATLVPATAVTGDNVVPMQKLVLADATAVNATGETQIATLVPAISFVGADVVAMEKVVVPTDESTVAVTLIPAMLVGSCVSVAEGVMIHDGKCLDGENCQLLINSACGVANCTVSSHVPHVVGSLLQKAPK